MELKSIFAPLWKWRWLIIIAGVIAGVISLLISFTQAPQYLSRTTLIIGQSINNPNPSSNQFYLEQQLATIYADMGTREPVRKGTMEALGMNWLPSYTIRALPDTQLIEISVTDTDPNRAKAVAQELANQLILSAPTSVNSDEQNRQEFIADQLATLETDIKSTQDDIEQKKINLGTLSSASQISSTEQQIAALELKLSTLQDTYASLLSSTSKGALNSLTVIEPAQVPSKSISPSKIITSGLAALVGILLAAIGIFLLEWLDQSINVPEDVTKIMNAQLLGEIPKVPKEENPLSYVNDQPFSPITDSFRSLRNNLEFMDLGKSIKTILVTSPGISEGKTTISMNLALSFAKANKRVILIDADFYQSTIKNKFSLQKETGLSDLLLSNRDSISQHLVSLFNGQVYLLPAGKTPPNPSELLSSVSTEKIFETLKNAADIIIIDGPPFITSDAFVLATKADGVLVVISPGKSRRDILNMAHTQLVRAKAKIIGFVMNGSSQRSAYYSYYQKPKSSTVKTKSSQSLEKSAPPKRIVDSSKKL
jgi:capsular exopolysaccharide synthesis family protein